jgi:galactitol-specific phosphotransferase system IIB component
MNIAEYMEQRGWIYQTEKTHGRYFSNMHMSEDVTVLMAQMAREVAVKKVVAYYFHCPICKKNHVMESKIGAEHYNFLMKSGDVEVMIKEP